ncbi:MAG TPA: (2Fe-2S) ferredoxin domain-containing protein [Gammaproteobacteria bacterium]|nr:(2Fe-2S) ferredoxin domain-containing protein [Gammaproteobacteria bacterium]
MYYRHHVFFCTNRREDGRACCEDHQATAARAHVKARVQALGLAVPGGVRINTAGCLNRCGEGPVLVVYPEGVWYSYRSLDDLDEIIQSHLCEGRVVERLRI